MVGVDVGEHLGDAGRPEVGDQGAGGLAGEAVALPGVPRTQAISAAPAPTVAWT